MKNKFIAIAAITVVLLAFPVRTAYAYEEIDWNKVYTQEEGKYKRGGVNTFCHETCNTQEDSDNLEAFLNGNPDYILINTYNKDISDEEWKTIKENLNLFPFDYYLNEDFEFGFTNNKVYVYKPLYDITMKHIQNGEKTDQMTQTYFSSTAVVVSDSQWFYRERSGQVVQEFNEHFTPRDTVFGFIQFESPIDCEIKIRNTHDNIYNVIYVSHDEPFLIRFPYGAYEITDINFVEMPQDEETLGAHNNNVFFLDDRFTEKEPKIITIEAAVRKYDIQPLDISDKPDFSWENRDNVTEEEYAEDRTIDNEEYHFTGRPDETTPEETEPEVTEPVETTEPEIVTVPEKPKEKSQSVIRTILLIIAALVVAVLATVLTVIKKKNNKDSEV